MNDAFDGFYDRSMDAEIEAREEAERIQLDYEFWLDVVAGAAPRGTVVDRGRNDE